MLRHEQRVKPMSEEMFSPDFTHFSATGKELSTDYYLAIGRALYRWSQLEAAVCTLAASVQGPNWLEAVRQLRGPHGFKVKNVFEQLKAEANRRKNNSTVLGDLDSAERLYVSRKVLFHSVWGHVSGPNGTAIGIQEWTNETYDNFRPVTLPELSAFAADCASTWQRLMTSAIPLFHDSRAILVDDGDGLTKGLPVEGG